MKASRSSCHSNLGRALYIFSMTLLFILVNNGDETLVCVDIATCESIRSLVGNYKESTLNIGFFMSCGWSNWRGGQ